MISEFKEANHKTEKTIRSGYVLSSSTRITNKCVVIYGIEQINCTMGGLII